MQLSQSFVHPAIALPFGLPLITGPGTDFAAWALDIVKLAAKINADAAAIFVHLVNIVYSVLSG